MQNITRRQAAKAVALGTAAAFVAPAALADDNPDADILALAREVERIETVVLPPLQKAYDDAEMRANELAAPSMKAPRLTPDQIDAKEADMLNVLRNEKGERGEAMRDLFEANYPGLDYETGVKEMYSFDRKAWREYSNWYASRLQAEKDVGFFEKEQRMDAAEGEAEAIREKICTIPARTEAGYLVKLKIAMDALPSDSITDPEYVTDKALVSLMRDMQAGA